MEYIAMLPYDTCLERIENSIDSNAYEKIRIALLRMVLKMLTTSTILTLLHTCQLLVFCRPPSGVQCALIIYLTFLPPNGGAYINACIQP